MKKFFFFLLISWKFLSLENTFATEQNKISNSKASFYKTSSINLKDLETINRLKLDTSQYPKEIEAGQAIEEFLNILVPEEDIDTKFYVLFTNDQNVTLESHLNYFKIGTKILEKCCFDPQIVLNTLIKSFSDFFLQGNFDKKIFFQEGERHSYKNLLGLIFKIKEAEKKGDGLIAEESLNKFLSLIEEKEDKVLSMDITIVTLYFNLGLDFKECLQKTDTALSSLEKIIMKKINFFENKIGTKLDFSPSKGQEEAFKEECLNYLFIRSIPPLKKRRDNLKILEKNHLKAKPDTKRIRFLRNKWNIAYNKMQSASLCIDDEIFNH